MATQIVIVFIMVAGTNDTTLAADISPMARVQTDYDPDEDYTFGYLTDPIEINPAEISRHDAISSIRAYDSYTRYFGTRSATGTTITSIKYRADSDPASSGWQCIADSCGRFIDDTARLATKTVAFKITPWSSGSEFDEVVVELLCILLQTA